MSGPGTRRRSAGSLGVLIDSALGQRPLDLVITGAQVADVFAGCFRRADVGIVADTIAAVDEFPALMVRGARQRFDWTGKYLVPGFIDPHIHMGGSQVSVTEWARGLVRHGTTTIATELAEVYSYAGLPAVRASLREAARAGLRVWFLAPLHLFGLEGQGTFRHPPAADEMETMLGWPETLGVNEPPPAQVIGKNPSVVRVLAAVQRRGQLFSGH